MRKYVKMYESILFNKVNGTVVIIIHKVWNYILEANARIL